MTLFDSFLTTQNNLNTNSIWPTSFSWSNLPHILAYFFPKTGPVENAGDINSQHTGTYFELSACTQVQD